MKITGLLLLLPLGLTGCGCYDGTCNTPYRQVMVTPVVSTVATTGCCNRVHYRTGCLNSCDSLSRTVVYDEEPVDITTTSEVIYGY